MKIAKCKIKGEKWWNDDESRWSWSYYLICPFCGPIMNHNFGDLYLMSWKTAMSTANRKGERS